MYMMLFSAVPGRPMLKNLEANKKRRNLKPSTGGEITKTGAGGNEAKEVYERTGDWFNAEATAGASLALVTSGYFSYFGMPRGHAKARPAATVIALASGAFLVGPERISDTINLPIDAYRGALRTVNNTAWQVEENVPQVIDPLLDAAKNVAGGLNESAATGRNILGNATNELGQGLKDGARRLGQLPDAIARAMEGAGAAISSAAGAAAGSVAEGVGGAAGTINRVGVTVEKVTYALLAIGGVYIAYKLVSKSEA